METKLEGFGMAGGGVQTKMRGTKEAREEWRLKWWDKESKKRKETEVRGSG